MWACGSKGGGGGGLGVVEQDVGLGSEEGVGASGVFDDGDRGRR